MARLSSRSILALPALLLALAADAAVAQQCGVRNRFRLANSHALATSERSVDTGWQTQAPLVTPGSNDNSGPTCSSRGTCTPTSDYGHLHVQGTGSANNCGSGGTFLVFDGGPQVQFSDVMTVVSGTLPHGTPVQVRVVLSLAGHATLVDTNPAVNYVAAVYASSLSLTRGSPGVTAGVIHTSVGAAISVSGQLTVSVWAYGVMGLGIPPAYASYDVDLGVRVGIGCETPGASLSFCSGRGYPTLTAEVVSVGGGCGAGSPSLSATLPQLGQTQTFTLSSAPANRPVFLVFGIGVAVSTPLGPCVLTEDLASLLLLPAGTTDASGGNRATLAIPATSSLVGQPFTVQELVLVPGGPLLGGAVLSDGVQSTIGL